MMTEEEAHAADLKIAASLHGKLCEGCPPERFPDAPTRCLPCPRRAKASDGTPYIAELRGLTGKE